jgi:hypothetical protein
MLAVSFRFTHLLGVLLTCLVVPPAIGEERPQSAPRFEVYSGVDYAHSGAAIYENAVWSLFGPVTEPGFRVEAIAAGTLSGSGSAAIFSKDFSLGRLVASDALLAGYQFNAGSLWLKLYAGVAYQSLAQPDRAAGLTFEKRGFGTEVAVESWWRPAERVWASADLSFVTVNEGASLYARVGYEIFRSGRVTLSLGSDFSLFEDGIPLDSGSQRLPHDLYLREGGLLNARAGAHDLTLSGGFAESSKDGAREPYLTLSYGLKF